MRLRHLEIFNAVMDVGTVTGASAALSMSQGSVSKVLQHFELQLGLPLFIRQSGRLVPTPEARTLHRETGKLVLHLKSVRRVAATLPQRAARLVRVMATPSLSTALLPEAMMAWRRHYPSARCEVSSHHTAEMLPRLLLGEADFGISLQNAKTEGIQARLLVEHHMLVAARPGTWQEGCTDPLPLAAILGQLVGIAPTDPLGCLVLAAVDAHGLTWNRPTIAQTHQLAAALAASGHGLSLIDPFTARAMNLQTRPSIPRFPVGLWLLQREGAALPREAQKLIDAISATAQHACIH